MSHVNRRQFLQWSGAVGGGLAASATLPINVLADNKVESTSKEEFKWALCTINCGSKCALRVCVEDGKIKRIETDNTGNDIYGVDTQVRACLRGRSNRFKIYSPTRLTTPLKRVGKRGEGKFEPIEWDEALDIVAKKMLEVKEKYGNEAFYIHYGTGTIGGILSLGYNGGPWHRLLGLFGGWLGYYNTYSTAQITDGMKNFYGENSGSSIANISHSKLVVEFGNNPAETRMSGAGISYASREEIKANNTRVIHIDPRYSDSMIGACDEWIPIAPGTDAALIAALAFVMITEDLHDKEFLKKYCIGFSKDTLPEDAPQDGSYEDYVLGNGPDKTAKTPQWAEKITKIPASRIIKLAREIAIAKPCYISQGWGPQRHMNGEQIARAIATLACMTGNVGILGGNNGGRETSTGNIDPNTLPYTNPIKDSISFFTYTDAILRGHEMTDIADGVRGTNQLKSDIKFLLNTCGNALINQHSDSNRTHEILSDETKCEFILDVNITRTASNRYADIILPDATALEQEDLSKISAGYTTEVPYMVYSQKAIEPVGKAMPNYDMCVLLAEKLGGKELVDKFTEGKTRLEWLELLWNKRLEKTHGLPSFTELRKMGMFKGEKFKRHKVVHEKFVQDPVANPLNTPTGKIEIFSTNLYKISKTWTIPKNQVITPLPEFIDTEFGPLDPARKTYPLQLIGWHYKGRTHSSFWESAPLREINPNELWLNPIDAKKRDIKTGDKVHVYNQFGKTLLVARVTNRIMPGVSACPQGGWYKPVKGVDVGGCVNVLTTLTPSPIAKGNPQHSNLVEVVKVKG
ncbi:MAG: DMSO/selenate family reductase complex A subunit [Campylobacteraceae bacterium]